MPDLPARANLAPLIDQGRLDGRGNTSLPFGSPTRHALAEPSEREALHRMPFEVEDVDPPVDFEPISRTKITPAPVRPETLHRERLLDWLDRHTRRRLTFVVANAGYGKTTLLADFSEQAPRRCIWFRLDHTDGDWVTFLNYMAAAIQTIAPDFGRATYSLFAQVAVAKPSLEAAIGAFMVDIGTLADEPLLLMLDDYHLVDEAPDVHAIIGRLLRDGPPSLHFLIASRREPELPLARLQAHGEVASIDSTDLRFTRAELETLFADGFGQPLEPDILDMLERRTEGWAACIQLLQGTLRDMRAVEIRRFVEHFSVTDGPVYEYLAQEVLREARPDLRAFLVRSSILDPVVPALVVAAMMDLPRPPPEVDVRELIRRAYEVGLLSRRDVTGGTFRFHPLLREFLEGQLAQELSDEDLAAVHLRVAHAAEPEDWLVACRHYLAGGDQAGAVRLLDRSVLTAVGTGAWGQAAEIVAALRGATAAPDVEVILAMEEIEEGRLTDAITRLEAIDRRSLSPLARALVRHGLLRAHYLNGDRETAAMLVDEVLLDPGTPQLFRNLADAHRLVFSAGIDTTLDLIVSRLEELARQHQEAELPFFAAISLHNLTMAHLYRGDYLAAIATGIEAASLFESTGRVRECHSTNAVLAICSAELGRIAEAREYAEVARKGLTDNTDGLEPLTYLALSTGDESFVGSIVDAIAAMGAQSQTPPAARTEAAAMRRFAAITRPELAASASLDLPVDTIGFGSGVEAASLRAIGDFLSGHGDIDPMATANALNLARKTGSARWATRLEILLAVESGDAQRLTRSIERAALSGLLALTDMAEVLVEGLPLLGAVPDAIRASARAWPARWLPLLRRTVSKGYGPSGLAAACALDELGALGDVPLLRAFDRTFMRGSRQAGLGRALVASKSPTVEIHDLGRSFIRVGDRVVPIGSIRRRAAALLYYLVSRPTQTATREQIMDELWPDLVPTSAANSLNQTLYFLRREIDPYYDEDESYDYVSNRGELAWLDHGKIRISSHLFAADAASALRVIDEDTAPASTALRRYSGRFAAEFEYEDWAQDWRDHLHSSFLHLGRSLQRALALRGALGDAVEVATFVLAEDPRALDVERALVWTYVASESNDAAAQQYRHFASNYREVFAVQPPTFADVKAGGPSVTELT
jgi:LuxR family maltose regulon positive regulatory protein